MQAQPENRSHSQPRAPSGLMRRLRRHQAGSVLPIMAMAIIPLAGLVGGGVDMSRMYLAKARLQQACDAGALAGRKVMAGGAWGNATAAPNVAALQFFDGNFADGAYGTTGRTRAYAESAGRVTGTASVTVPMSVIRIFGINAKTIAVTCDAEMRLPNTDIMFVLDTTGSMGWTLSGDTQSKMTTLKFAVKCFYEVVAKLDSEAVCPGTAPSGGTSGVQIRFGFMPYATNVNVGKLLPTTYFANSWHYQTRQMITRTETYWDFPTQGTPTVTSTQYNDMNNAPGSSWSNFSEVTTITDDEVCDDTPSPAPILGTPSETEGSPQNTNTTTSGGTRTTTWYTDQDYSGTRRRYDWNNGKCWIQHRAATFEVRRYYTRVDNGVQQTREVFDKWSYWKWPLNVSGLKSGTVSATNPYGWASSVTFPTLGDGGTSKTVGWDGCIEERTTVKQTSYSPIPANARDLNMDLVPSSGDPDSMWGPLLRYAIYERGQFAERITSSNLDNSPSYACPTEAKKLQAWTTASTFDAYVNSLGASGSTYHDIGMIWGARFISPTGIFASENALTPQGGEIERHLIFMTDGETCTTTSSYNAYGVAWYDRRQSDTEPTMDATCPGVGANSASSLLNAQVDARFSAMCQAVKDRNITLWVVYFGTTDAATTTRMTNCATSGRFYPAANSTALINTFRSIADQISQLRLTR